MPTNLTLTAELADNPDGNIYLSILDRLHTCLGQNFALIEAGYVLLQKYDDADSIPLRRPGVTGAPHHCFVHFHGAEY